MARSMMIARILLLLTAIVEQAAWNHFQTPLCAGFQPWRQPARVRSRGAKVFRPMAATNEANHNMQHHDEEATNRASLEDVLAEAEEAGEIQNGYRCLGKATRLKIYSKLDQVIQSHCQQSNDRIVPLHDIAAYVPYPDHEFAIHQSRLFVDWSLSGCVTFDHIVDKNMLKNLFLQSNLPSGTTLPWFVDANWEGDDKSIPLPGEPSQDVRWRMPEYYNVHPLLDFDPEEEDHYCVEFNKTSTQRFLKRLEDDLKGARWNSFMLPGIPFEKEGHAQVAKAFTAGYEVYDAHVLSFVSNHGDRVEYWRSRPEHDDWGSYVILQTRKGGLLIVAVASAHPMVFCNLLELFNSDGSGDMPRLFPPDYASYEDDQMTAEILIKSTISSAMDFLYKQEH